MAAAAGAAACVLVAGCGSSAPKPVPAPPTQRVFPPAPEPAAAPPLTGTPPGRLIALPAGGHPEGLVVDAAGLAVAALRGPARLALVDLTAGTVRTVPVPGAARHLSLSTPAGPVLVPGEDTDLLSEVALPGGRVLGSTKVGRQPHDAASVAGTAVVADELGGQISLVRAGRVTTVFAGPVQPGGVAAAGARVGVVDVGGALLFVVDPAARRVVGVLKAGDGPTHAVDDSRGRLVVADTRGGALLVYDLAGIPRLVGRLPLAGSPYGLAVDGTRHRLYVALSATNRLVRYDVPATGLPVRAAGDTPTVRQPNSLAVDPRSGNVVVAGEADDRLQVVTP